MICNAEIKLAEETDAEAILDIYAPFVRSSAITFETMAPSVLEIKDRIRKIKAVYPWLVATLDHKIVGYAYASQHRERAAYNWSAEVSVYIHPGFQRKSLGGLLYNKLFQILELQGFRNLYAGITLPNEASINLHKKCGFEPAGVFHKVGNKFGQWQDVAWFEKVTVEHTADTSLPAKLSLLLENEELKSRIACILKE